MVEKGTRHCSNIGIYLVDRNNYPYSTRKKEYKRIQKIIPAFLRPRYLKGTIVKADPRTIGLMCFDRIDRAYIFLRANTEHDDRFKVIKVRGKVLDSKSYYTTIIRGCAGNPFRLLDVIKLTPDYGKSTIPPESTIWCSEVEVLE